MLRYVIFKRVVSGLPIFLDHFPCTLFILWVLGGLLSLTHHFRAIDSPSSFCWECQPDSVAILIKTHHMLDRQFFGSACIRVVTGRVFS